MSSVLVSALANLQLNNYVTVVVLTAVGYDYIITFSKEVEYVWGKPWTWVSTLYILVRSCGLYNLVANGLRSSFLPAGSAKTYVFVLSSLSRLQGWDVIGEIISVTANWIFVLFLSAADFVMMLRVWAMYNRSRLILVILLLSFVLEVIVNVLTNVIITLPANVSVTIIQIQDFSFCSVPLAGTSIAWTELAASVEMANGAVMCILAIVQFVRQTLQMYSVTKQWQLNRYMNLLVRQGVLYFFGILVFNLINLLSILGKLPTGGWLLFLAGIMEYVPMSTLSPRFILSMRELYAQDVHRCGPGGVDSAFGLSSAGRSAIGTVILFADVGQNEGSEDIGERPLGEVMEVGTTRQN